LPGLDRDLLVAVALGREAVPACVARCGSQEDAQRIQRVLEGLDVALAEDRTSALEAARSALHAVGSLRSITKPMQKLAEAETRRDVGRFVGKIALGSAVPLAVVAILWLMYRSALASQIISGLVLAGAGGWLVWGAPPERQEQVRNSLLVLLALVVGGVAFVFVAMQRYEPLAPSGGRGGGFAGSSSEVSLSDLKIRSGGGSGGGDWAPDDLDGDPEPAHGPFAQFAADLPPAPACDPGLKEFATLLCQLRAMALPDANAADPDLDMLADGLETTEGGGEGGSGDLGRGSSGGGQRAPAAGRLRKGEQGDPAADDAEGPAEESDRAPESEDEPAADEAEAGSGRRADPGRDREGDGAGDREGSGDSAAGADGAADADPGEDPETEPEEDAFAPLLGALKPLAIPFGLLVLGLSGGVVAGRRKTGEVAAILLVGVGLVAVPSGPDPRAQIDLPGFADDEDAPDLTPYVTAVSNKFLSCLADEGDPLPADEAGDAADAIERFAVLLARFEQEGDCTEDEAAMLACTAGVQTQSCAELASEVSSLLSGQLPGQPPPPQWADDYAAAITDTVTRCWQIELAAPAGDDDDSGLAARWAAVDPAELPPVPPETVADLEQFRGILAGAMGTLSGACTLNEDAFAVCLSGMHSIGCVDLAEKLDTDSTAMVRELLADCTGFLDCGF